LYTEYRGQAADLAEQQRQAITDGAKTTKDALTGQGGLGSTIVEEGTKNRALTVEASNAARNSRLFAANIGNVQLHKLEVGLRKAINPNQPIENKGVDF